MTKKREDVYSISGVGDSLTAAQSARSRRYMFSMGLRMVCFPLAVIIDGPMRWVLLVGSLVLPWVAVVVANAGLENQRRSSPIGSYGTGRELE